MAMTKDDIPKEILIHYIKTSSYRTYHVDGAYGGLTPQGGIYCEFYVERNVTPKTISYGVDNKGRLGVPKKTTGKEGFVREIECGIALDVKTARALRNWLDDRLKEYDDNIKFLKKGD